MKKNLETAPKRGASVLKARREQRTRMQQELACLTPFLTEWFWQNEEMKEAKPYQDPEFLTYRWQKGRYYLLGGPGFGYGELQKKMDREMDGILKRLKADMPFLPESDFFAFSYFAAGFDNALVAHLAGLSSAKDASMLKTRLKDAFLKLNSPSKFEYLELLPPRQLPNWQRNAIFA
jgi:hypothetical protein